MCLYDVISRTTLVHLTSRYKPGQSYSECGSRDCTLVNVTIKGQLSAINPRICLLLGALLTPGPGSVCMLEILSLRVSLWISAGNHGNAVTVIQTRTPPHSTVTPIHQCVFDPHIKTSPFPLTVAGCNNQQRFKELDFVVWEIPVFAV